MHYYLDNLKDFSSDAEQTKTARDFFSLWQKTGDALLRRESPAHVTVSAFTVDETLSQTLFVYHPVFQAYSFAGGHADGEKNLLQKAAAELYEETGVRAVPFGTTPVSVDVLPVFAHVRLGKTVQAHSHLNVTFVFAADKTAKRTPLSPPADTRWLPLKDLLTQPLEKHMLPVYRRCVEGLRRLQREKADALSRLPALLVPWYEENKRDLPWRKDRDPYKIWLSEIMLQQTRVQAVCGYYQRFLQELPDVAALAACPDDKLMKLWEGLGYYSRARNLKAAAQKIVREYGGAFPKTVREWKSLPGVGDYTAGAVASIALGVPTAAVDGNVLRVAGRVLECYAPVQNALWRKALGEALTKVCPAQKSAEFTQSFMDLGASVCLPARPNCEICPLKDVCIARRQGTQEELPTREENAPRKTQKLTVFVLRHGQSLALQKRADKGLLGGLWEFPHRDGHLNEREAAAFLQQSGLKSDGAFLQTNATHVFTHLIWDMRVYTVDCADKNDSFVWACPDAPHSDISLPTAFRKCLL